MKKNSWLMLVDYLLTLILSIFGIFILSWMLDYSWGYWVYSGVFTFIFSALIYSRAWNTAKRELRNKERKPRVSDGVILSLPLLVFTSLIVIAFGLIYYNIIPIRDNVVDIVYSFKANEPKLRTEILLIDYLTPIVRLIFAPLIGFMHKVGKTSPLTMLIIPALTVCASTLGYYLGMKKYYISDEIMKVSTKLRIVITFEVEGRVMMPF